MVTSMFVESVSPLTVADVITVDAEVELINSIAVVYKWIVYTVMCPVIDIFGIVTNVINIVCFVKQGFSDPVNVNLLGLAIADLGGLVTVLWTNVCLNPEMAAADLPFDPIEVQYLVSGMPHATFTRISGWITALIAVERCLCISMPLRVNSIITTRRVSVVVVSIFIVMIASGSPAYVVNRLEFKFDIQRNRTLLGLVYTNDRESVDNISYLVNNVFLPFCAFFIIIASTLTLVFKLQLKTKWLSEATTATQAQMASNRNQKVAKMVVMISVLYIVCFIPLCILFITIALNPDFFINGKYINVLLMVGGIGILTESINSSVNIFIYYKMSSNYRKVFMVHVCQSRVVLK